MPTTWHPYYKIVPGSSGSFMCPPGHPSHSYTLEGYESARHRNPFLIGSIEGALADDFDGNEILKARVVKIFADAVMVESEMWVRSVYGYYCSMYTPESGSRDASGLVSHSPSRIAATLAHDVLAEAFRDIDGLTVLYPHADNYRNGVTAYRKRRGYEVTAAVDGGKVYVYALSDDGSRYDADHLRQYAAALEEISLFADVRHEPMTDTHASRIVADLSSPPTPMDPERHAAVACIREYFPGHAPRLDLIADPGDGYGSRTCAACGKRVQYEAKFDALAVVSTRMDGTGMTHWSYNTEHDDHTPHVTA